MNKEIFENTLKTKGITQRELARLLNMNNSRLSDMKNGRLHGYKYRRRISQYLGVDEDILFSDNGDSKQPSCQCNSEEKEKIQ